jgi:hypothetical protein
VASKSSRYSSPEKILAESIVFKLQFNVYGTSSNARKTKENQYIGIQVVATIALLSSVPKLSSTIFCARRTINLYLSGVDLPEPTFRRCPPGFVHKHKKRLTKHNACIYVSRLQQCLACIEKVGCFFCCFVTEDSIYIKSVFVFKSIFCVRRGMENKRKVRVSAVVR